jgi:hypothetical protein
MGRQGDGEIGDGNDENGILEKTLTLTLIFIIRKLDERLD